MNTIRGRSSNAYAAGLRKLVAGFALGARRRFPTTGRIGLKQFLVAALFLHLCRAQCSGAFVESGGLIVMEAEHFQSSTAIATHAWLATNTAAGFVGTAAMRALPNSGASVSAVSESPNLAYSIHLTNSGVFKLWIRAWGASGSDDSVYVGVDGGGAQTVGFSQTGVWVWRSVQVSITNSGPHTLNLWMREDGAYVDRILLARSLTFTPTGDGPPATTQVNAPGNTTFRWARESSRIYVENGGVATLTDIRTALPNAPLCLIDPANHIWFLDATLIVRDGATLRLHGSAIGGDVNELRLRSDNSMADGSCVVVDADWGTLDLRNVKVISWNQLAAAPDTEYATFQRAFIRARSRLVGGNLQQSTLNVVNSEIGYLGVHSSDGYGLAWDVVGTAPDATVFGEVSNSYIHHCLLGLATAQWGDVPWTGNNVVSNALYGFDPSAHNTVVGNTYGVVFRWAGVSDRIYVTGPGEATLSEIKNALPEAPLTQVDAANSQPALVISTNRTWYLGANLFVENGARLKLYGPTIGGDVTELRLKSDNQTNGFVELRADWGWLDIRHTKITSWDSAVNGPDTETTTHRRAYVRARSTLDPDGVTAHESRMDVLNSEICYLGSKNTEAYGLTWKVVDTTAVHLPPGSTNTLFDVVNVYGDILNSYIHHNFFGVYTYGHYGGQWRSNEVAHNIAYGFDPHDDSDNLVIEDNNVHHNGWHGIIASKRCDNGVLRNNKSWNNGLDLVDPHGNGIMLHRSCNDWVVENNQSYNNADSGIAIFATDRTLIRNNICQSNGNAGIRLSVGAEGNWVSGNEVSASGKYAFYIYEGNDPPEDEDVGTNEGRCRGNSFTDNFINGYGAEALKLSNCDENIFAGNIFIGQNTLLRLASGTNNWVSGNIVPSDTLVKLQGNSTNGVTEYSTTTFEDQPRLAVQLDVYSTGIFTNQSGAIFVSDQTDLATVVRPSGSVATLTSAQVGIGPGQVLIRNFFAVPNTGSAQINVTTWNLGGQRQKAWTVQGSSGLMQIAYRVGDLNPGTTYQVRRDSVLVASRQADSGGAITFTSSPVSTLPVTYSVTRN